MNNLEEAAVFILTIPPIEEITNTYMDVVERFRYNAMTKEEAIEELITCHQEKLQKFMEMNVEINEEIARCFV